MISYQETFSAPLARFHEFSDTKLREIYGGQNLLNEACLYALNAGGKKVRPLICLLACEAVSDEYNPALTPALAVEMVHTYSLIHDDLPAMDDDDLRRGKPSTHKKFDEASAILAGDGILTDAFQVLSHPSYHSHEYSPSSIMAMIRILSGAAGSQGMVLGQSLDLLSETLSEGDLKHLQSTHRLKTGYLMGAAAAMGSIANEFDDKVLQSFFNFGIAIGHSFQIRDDLIDHLPTTGKTQGKDKDSDKLTYLSFFSREKCQEMLREFCEQAFSHLDFIEERKLTSLRDLTKLLEFRDS